MVKKLVMALLCGIMLICSTAFGEELPDKWVWAYSDSSSSYYTDKTTVEYNPKKKQIVYWFYATSDTSNYLQKQEVDILKKTSRMLYREDNYYSNGQYYHIKGEYKNSHSYGLKPDSPYEKTANIALNVVGQEPVFGHAEHQWAWLGKFAKQDFYICTNTFSYDPKKHRALVYVNYNIGDYHNTGNGYDVDFKKKTIRFLNDSKWFDIKPGSLLDAIYQKAKEMVSYQE